MEQVLNGNGGTEYERYMAIIADVFRELAQRIADEELLLDTEVGGAWGGACISQLNMPIVCVWVVVMLDHLRLDWDVCVYVCVR